jgi:hypothetical protein
MITMQTTKWNRDTVTEDDCRRLVRFVMELEQNQFSPDPREWTDRELLDRLFYWLSPVLNWQNMKEVILVMEADGEIILTQPEPFSGKTCTWSLAEIKDMESNAGYLANHTFGVLTQQMQTYELRDLTFAAYWGPWDNPQVLFGDEYVGSIKNLVDMDLVKNEPEYAKKWTGSPIRVTGLGRLYAQVLREWSYLPVGPRVRPKKV